jgi:tetratricopeptide (TPR) repeat protein
LEKYTQGLYLFEDERVAYSDSPAARGLLQGLAQTLWDVGDWNKAALMYEQCLTFYPDDPQAPSARYFLADCLRRKGDSVGARKTFAELRDDTTAPTLWRDLATQSLTELDIDSVSRSVGIGSGSAAGGEG